MLTLTLLPESGAYDALVDRVVDGDTWDCLLFVNLRIRLDGVQTAERFTEKGQRVTQAVRDRLTRQFVRLDLRGKDKYGRMLARASADGLGDVGDWLVGQELAVPWDGRGPRPVGAAFLMPPEEVVE